MCVCVHVKEPRLAQGYGMVACVFSERNLTIMTLAGIDGYLLYARQDAKHFIYVTTFNLLSNSNSFPEGIQKSCDISWH